MVSALAVGNLVIVCHLLLIFMFDKNNLYLLRFFVVAIKPPFDPQLFFNDHKKTPSSAAK